MSYILDALNKSENERTRKRSPDTSALESGGNEKKSSGIKPGILIATVITIAGLNGAAIYYLFRDPGHQRVNQPESATIEPGPTIPPVKVTAHIYAEEAAFRSVTVNGVERFEGDFIDKNHQLISITETGLKLSYVGQDYEIEVVENWQLNSQ